MGRCSLGAGAGIVVAAGGSRGPSPGGSRGRRWRVVGWGSGLAGVVAVGVVGVVVVGRGRIGSADGGLVR